MIVDDFQFADRSQDPRYNPKPQTLGLIESLEAQGFRPFTEEW